MRTRKVVPLSTLYNLAAGLTVRLTVVFLRMTGFLFCAVASVAPKATSTASIAVKNLKLDIFFISYLVFLFD
jgi:hypothetical protein